MEQSKITVSARNLGEFDVAVAGGGVSGVAAAVTAAKHGCRVVLVEGCGCLGGALTAGLVPNMSLDREGKGGIVVEFFRFMDEHGFTCPRRGNIADEAGDPLPGGVVSPDGAKVLFDIWCREAGVTTLLYTHVIGAEMDGRSIRRLLLGSECGPATVRAKLYVDATGNGTLSLMAGCRGEFGDPKDGHPQPATLGFMMSGLELAESTVDKAAYGEELAATGLRSTNRRPCALKLPDMHNVLVWSNYEADVRPDDIFSLTSATMRAREECLAVAEAHLAIPAHRRGRLTARGQKHAVDEIAQRYSLPHDQLRGHCAPGAGEVHLRADGDHLIEIAALDAEQGRHHLGGARGVGARFGVLLIQHHPVVSVVKHNAGVGVYAAVVRPLALADKLFALEPVNGAVEIGLAHGRVKYRLGKRRHYRKQSK